MPFRVALTGRMQGPDVGEVMDLLVSEGVPDKAVKLEARVEALKAASAAHGPSDSTSPRAEKRRRLAIR